MGFSFIPKSSLWKLSTVETQYSMDAAVVIDGADVMDVDAIVESGYGPQQASPQLWAPLDLLC